MDKKILDLYKSECQSGEETLESESIQVMYGSKDSNKCTSQKGLKEGWTRVTFILKQEYLEKLKSISYWERVTIKEIIDEAVSNYLKTKAAKIKEIKF